MQFGNSGVDQEYCLSSVLVYSKDTALGDMSLKGKGFTDVG
jgi:hypothetical protein